ncbi:MAG: DUF5005 domain-containing protein [Salinivirgaceae bacterium]|nr:DUF5005 domain-containing protein [Salinivirgaceae bacterium]
MFTIPDTDPLNLTWAITDQIVLYIQLKVKDEMNSLFKIKHLTLKSIINIGILFSINILLSCSNTNTPVEVKEDSYFSDLFKRTGGGFTGGDGTYSVELPDGKTLWIFGDTFLGTIEPDGSRKKTNPMYIRNSFVVQDGNELTTLYQKIEGCDHSMIIPPKVIDSEFTITEEMQWYWPGDAFIENNELKVFVSEFHQSDTGMWSFEWKGTALVSFSLPEIKQTSIVHFNFNNEKEIHFGHAVFEDEDYTYIYGLGQGKPYVARVKAGNIEADWEFQTTQGWSPISSESIPMIEMDGSEQFTVMKRKGKYIYITQLGDFSTKICSFTSDKPYTGWSNKKELYSTPLPETKHNLITYNAVAHPQFIENNSLLISYNTNSFLLSDHFKNADIYRPRFIRVPFNMIHADF